MKVVCGWCQKPLGVKAPWHSKTVSHGMCADCAAKWRADAKARRRNPVRRNGIGGSLWRGVKAGYHDYRAGRYETKAAYHRSRAKLNPGRRTIPGRALEIRYLRSDGKRYFHPFEHPVKMIANRDGSVTLRGGKRIHADDGEPQFWERYGHGRHGTVKNPRRRRRSYSRSSSNNWLLYVGAAVLLYPMLTRAAGAVSTGGQMILPQGSEAVWYSDPYQSGDGTYFVGTLPPGAAPPWRLAAATEIGSMQAGLLSGYLYQAGGGLVAPAPGFTT